MDLAVPGKARPPVEAHHRPERAADPLLPESVVRGVKAGDAEAVGAVYSRLGDRLLGYLIARVHDRATAEDLLEATFIELLQRGCTINGGAHAIKAWLFRAAHFNALDHLRKVNRRPEDLHAELMELDVVDLGRGPAEHAEASEVARDVHAAMAQLSDDQRQVLLLRYLAGMPSREVAEVLGKSHGAVRSLQLRGERALARLLAASRPAAPSGGSATSPEQGAS